MFFPIADHCVPTACNAFWISNTQRQLDRWGSKLSAMEIRQLPSGDYDEARACCTPGLQWDDGRSQPLDDLYQSMEPGLRLALVFELILNSGSGQGRQFVVRDCG